MHRPLGMVRRITKLLAAAALYYAGIFYILRRLSERSGNAIMVGYHAVDADLRGASSAEVAAGLVVSSPMLEHQLAHLKERYRIVPLATVAAVARGTQVGGGLCAVTFDDALSGLARTALPVLVRLSIPATVFVPTGYVGRSEELLAFRLLRAGRMAESPSMRAQIGGQLACLPPRPVRASTPPGDRQHKACQHLASRAVMDEEEILGFVRAGIAVGSHGRWHVAIVDLPVRAQREELSESRRGLEELTGHSVEAFCYPYGESDLEVAAQVMAAGYVCACTTKPGWVRCGDDPYLLRRVMLDENSGRGVWGGFSRSVFEASIWWALRRCR